MSHKFDYSEMTSKIYVPEKGLLAGVLELAVRDLSSCVGNWSLRKDAFKWILSKAKPKQFSFTFKFVVSALDLTEVEIKFIIDKALKSREEYKTFRDVAFSNIRERNGRESRLAEEKAQEEKAQEGSKRESQRRESRTGICNSPGRPGDALSSKVLTVQC